MQQQNAGQTEAFIKAPKRAKKSKFANFCNFLYNKQQKTVLGRTCKSWGQITAFYIVFYAALAGFFAICLAVFVKSADEHQPRFFGKGSIIGNHPGLGYQPWIRSDPDSSLIKFDPADPESYEKYTTQMTEFIETYANVTDEKRKKCSSTTQLTDQEIEEGWVCKFDDADLKGYLGKLKCDSSNDYGFAAGKPCVALTLNRMLEWQPVAFPKDSTPDIIKGRYKPDAVAISCEGEYPADKDSIGNTEYYPEDGFPSFYFPYVFTPSYRSPVALIQFQGLPTGQVVFVECKAYAYNIVHDRTNKLGLVTFELLKQSASQQN